METIAARGPAGQRGAPFGILAAMGRRNDGGSRRQDALAWLGPAVLLCAAVCGGFAATASAIVFAAYIHYDAPHDEGFLLRLAVKGLVTAGFAVSALAVLYRTRKQWGGTSSVDEPAATKGLWFAIAASVLAAAFLALPNAAANPLAEPDELHHLIVAQNIAEHGVYGSGHPATGFLWFDQYDSVGAPVLFPVAWSYEVLGTGFGPARWVMVLYAMGLAAATAFFWARPYGAIPALAGALFLLAAPMTPYLARTLYGEGPALMWLFLGLAGWRRSFGRSWSPWAFAAGLLFGFAILSKTYLLLSCFAFAGAALFDWLGARRLGWGQIVLPAVGVVTVLGLWSAYESLHAHDVAGSAQSTLMEYQHNLMIGFGALDDAFAWWVARPHALLLCVVGFLTGAWTLVRRPDPAMAAAWLFAVFVLFWWMFFTNGHIQRYAWYGVAILAAQAGASLVAARSRAAYACAALIAIGLLWETAAEYRRFLAEDAMAAENAVARYVAALPDGAAVGVGFWPLTRHIHFAADRVVPVARDADGFDVLVTAEGARNTAEADAAFAESRRFGRYVVYTRIEQE